MSGCTLASTRVRTSLNCSNRVLSLRGQIAAYSTNAPNKRSTNNKRVPHQTPKLLTSPALRQAMMGENPEVHKRYVEQSVTNFKQDLPSMESRSIAHLMRASGRVGRLQDAMEMYEISLKHGKATEHTVETMLKACFDCNAPEKADAIIKQATEAGVPIGKAVIATLQIGYTKAEKLDLAYETFVAARVADFPLDSKDNDLLAACVKSGIALQVNEIFKTMYSVKEQYGLPDDETWTAVSLAAAAGNQIGFLLDTISQVGDEDAKKGKFPVSFYANLIVGANPNSPELAWNLYVQAKNAGVTLTSQHCHMILQSFYKAKATREADVIYEDMKASGVKPDEVTFQSIITNSLKVGDFSKVQEILADMRKLQVPIKLPIYSAIFTELSKAGNLTGCLDLLTQMNKDGVKPTAVMWTHLMRSAARAIQYDRANRAMAQLNTKIEEVSYKSLLNTVTKVRLGEYSATKLNELLESGEKFDSNISNILVMMADEDDGSNMEAILSQMKEADVNPDAYFFNFLIESAIRRKNYNQAKRIMLKMQDLQVIPDEVTWSIYIKALGAMGKVEEVLYIWNNKLVKRSLIDYNTILHQMRRCGRLDLVAKIFNEMNQTGIEPNDITCGILMSAYGSALQLDRCFEIFNAFKVKLGRLTGIAYNILLGCCLANKRADLAIKILDEMTEQGLQPQSTLAWTEASAAIRDINDLESSWDSVQKQPTGVGAYADLVKLSVKGNRPDLVQRVVNMTFHTGSQLKWDEVIAELNDGERETIDTWVRDGRMSLQETDVLSLQSMSSSNQRGPRKHRSESRGHSRDTKVLKEQQPAKETEQTTNTTSNDTPIASEQTKTETEPSTQAQKL